MKPLFVSVIGFGFTILFALDENFWNMSSLVFILVAW